MEGMIVEAGPLERDGIAGPRSAYPKAFVTQRKQKRDTKRMVLSSNAEQVRSHVSILIAARPDQSASEAYSRKLSARKAESIRMRQQARRSALHIVEG